MASSVIEIPNSSQFECSVLKVRDSEILRVEVQYNLLVPSRPSEGSILHWLNLVSENFSKEVACLIFSADQV